MHDDGGGPALYAGGHFTSIGGVPASNIAKWNGSSWSALGSGPLNTVYALAVYDDGGGPALYAGGAFPGGGVAHALAEWNGASWSLIGAVSGTVFVLEVHDDGTGPALYAGGSFTSVGGVPASGITRWNGASWSALGSGMSLASVKALAVHDAGDGPALYAGGSFQSAGGVAASCIAKWNGASWSALGSGVDDSLGFRSVDALASCDVAGPVLYVGGTFTTAGGLAAGNIAKWDGQGWTGSGFNDAPRAMAVYDDGGGPALYAGGYFTSAGGVAVSHVARWNGSSWSPLGSGISSEVFSLCVHDDGGGPAIACPTARAKS